MKKAENLPMIVSISDAHRRLSSLISRAVSGERILIARADERMVALSPISHLTASSLKKSKRHKSIKKQNEPKTT